MTDRPRGRALIVAAWGVTGVLLLLGQAIVRLGERALEAHAHELSTLQVGVLALWVGISLYGEGYRAFQLRFSPRVVKRALFLGRRGNLLQSLLAPAFCMSLFHATTRGRIVAWSTVVMVICLVMLVSRLPQPWRGIIDAGVVLALLWGALAIIVYFARAIAFGEVPAVDAALPAASSGADP